MAPTRLSMSGSRSTTSGDTTSTASRCAGSLRPALRFASPARPDAPFALLCDALFGRLLQGRTGGLPAAQLSLALLNVVSCQRDGVLPLCELDLEDHVPVDAERRFRSRQIELPHPAETLVVEAFGFLAISHEPIAPGAKRLCVVQPQNLDVGDEEPRPFDRREDLRKARNVAAREDVLADPRIGCARHGVPADRVEQHHAVVIELPANGLEKFVVAEYANMLEHANRHDAVEGFPHVAIVLQRSEEHT